MAISSSPNVSTTISSTAHNHGSKIVSIFGNRATAGSIRKSIQRGYRAYCFIDE